MMRLAAFVAVALAAEELPRYATTKTPNQPPSISYSGPKVAVDEGERFDLNIDVRDADVDEDYAGQLDVVCEGGRLDVSSKAGLRFRDAADGVAFRGPQQFVQKALQPLVYTAPSKGRGGDATIRCTVDDLGYSGVGGPRNATVTIPISIKNVNDAPIIDAPAMLEVRGEEPLPISMSDPDSDVLSLSLRASHGMLRWAGGDAASVLEASGSSDRLAERLRGLTYVPQQGYDGLATVSVERRAETKIPTPDRWRGGAGSSPLDGALTG